MTLDLSLEPDETAVHPAPDTVPSGSPAGTGDLEVTEASADATTAVETRRARFGRKARRTRLHLYAFLSVALLVCLVALVVANTRLVELNWMIGSSTVSLVWLVLFSAILGWLLGILTTALFRWRTRAPRA